MTGVGVKAFGMNFIKVGLNGNVQGDCATNYDVGEGQVFQAKLTCWTDKERWSRPQQSKGNFVRCTGYECPCAFC